MEMRQYVTTSYDAKYKMIELRIDIAYLELCNITNIVQH